MSHEDFINKSLLDSLDAQADAEPIPSSSDSVATSNSSSDGGSPSVPYHIPMHHSIMRSDPSMLKHIESLQFSSQNASYARQTMYASPIADSTYNVTTDHTPDHDSRNFQKQQNSESVANMVRPDMASFLNTARARLSSRPVFLSHQYRDAATNLPSSPPDGYPPSVTSPMQPQMPSIELRTNYDYRGQINADINGNVLPNSLKELNHGSIIQSNQVNGHKSHQPQSSQQPSYPHLYNNGAHISSQTPYGPHVLGPAVSSSTMNGTSSNPPLKPAASVPSLTTLANNSPCAEEISTIFVVGFPEDMQEREFQNMFTFSPDFEAATLKIPNKEYTAYSSLTSSGLRGYPSAAGANDPYNLVTVNQGGVVVDTVREGSIASWPTALGEEVNGHVNAGNNASGSNVPRKQIIGFAKFRTREAALIARDGLQGRRVDIDKGAVLKAEMAKKNLHTKRGVGPVSASTSGPSNGSLPVSSTLSVYQAYINSTSANAVTFTDGPGPREREIGTIAAMGLGGRLNQWRDSTQQQEQQRTQQDHLPHGAGGTSLADSSDDDRRANLVNAMGLTALGSITRGPRERAEDDERRRKEKDASRVRASNAYETFQSLPLAVSGQMTSTGGQALLPIANKEVGVLSPWDDLRNRVSRSHSLSRPSSPSKVKPTLNDFTPSLSPADQSCLHFFSQSRREFSAELPTPLPHTNVASTGDTGDAFNSDIDISRSFIGLDINTVAGKTSPELPSPSSGASSRNAIDQNPPINTLYVGNLPTSSIAGSSNDLLEANLRELFQSRPGYRRLCFRQKPNGPMCFVEFDDVAYATKALNDLYGNTLKGVVKGGIRLSYSKNPLGVRTPTTIGNNTAFQSQFQNSGSLPDCNNRLMEEQLPRTLSLTYRQEMAASSSPLQVNQSFMNDMSSPQFPLSLPGPVSSVAPTSLLTGSADAFVPRYGYTLSPGNNGQSISTFSPFGMSMTPPAPPAIPEQQTTRSDQ